MGKKNKSKYDKLDYHGKLEADRKMAEQYGIDVSQYGNQGRPGAGGVKKKSYDDLKQDVARAAANDYDVRRSIEAAQLAGNKKAQKIGSISNASEAYAATRFMEKTHKKRMGNGGAYDGANDQGGVTNYWVNKDRDKQNSMFATKDDLSALQQQKDASAVKEEPYEESEALTKAKERVAAWEDSNAGTDPSPYGATGSKVDFSSAVYGNNRDASGEPANGEQAQGQLDKFKAELKDRKNIQKIF